MITKAAPLVVAGLIALLSAAAPASVHAQEPSLSGPTQQLFEAVRRKDLAAAQAAVGAGADVEARNALGLRAVDMAVDLGNFDIAHYLLAVSSAKAKAGVEAAAARQATVPSAGLSAPLIGADGVPAASPVVPVKRDQIGGTTAAPRRAPAAAPAPSRSRQEPLESVTAAPRPPGARQEASPPPPAGPNLFDLRSQPRSFTLPIVGTVQEPGQNAAPPAAAPAPPSVPATQAAPTAAEPPQASPSGSAQKSPADGPGLVDWFGGLFRKSEKPAASIPAEGAQAEPAGAPPGPLASEVRPKEQIAVPAPQVAASEPAAEASAPGADSASAADVGQPLSPFGWLIGFVQPLLPATAPQGPVVTAPAAVEPIIVATAETPHQPEGVEGTSPPSPIDWLVSLWRSSSSIAVAADSERNVAPRPGSADRDAIVKRPELDRRKEVAAGGAPPQPSATAVRAEAAPPALAPIPRPAPAAEPISSKAMEEVAPGATAPASSANRNDGPDLLARIVGFFKTAAAPPAPPRMVVALAPAETPAGTVPTAEPSGLPSGAAAVSEAARPEAPGFFSRLAAFFGSAAGSAPAYAGLAEAPNSPPRIEIAAKGAAGLASFAEGNPAKAAAQPSDVSLNGADRASETFESAPDPSLPPLVAAVSGEGAAEPEAPQIAAAPTLLPTPIPAAEPKPGFLDRLAGLFRVKQGGDKPDVHRVVAALAPQRPQTPLPPLPHFVEAADLAIGDSLRLGRSRAGAMISDSECIEKRSWNVWFCVEPVDWPASIAPAFDANSVLYRGPQTIVRYDGEVATQYHVVFPATNFAAVVAHFTKILGAPTETPEVRTAMIAAPARINATVRWEAPESGGNQILEIRQIDDLRWVMPDTQVGVVRLYRKGAEPVFTLLSISDLQFSRLRRPSGG